MALEHDTQELYDFYKSDTRVKQYIDSLPTNRWLPELQRMYDARYNYNTDGIGTVLGITTAAMIFAGLLYLI